MIRASLSHHIAKQMLLSVVRREDGNLLRGVSTQSHVLIHAHDVLGLLDVLIKEWRRRGLFPSHVDELQRMRESGVGARVRPRLRAG